WDQLVAYLSGGLLYGSEVERPKSIGTERKKRYVRHEFAVPGREEIVRMLWEGRTKAEMTAAMGIGLGALNNRIHRIYVSYGVGRRKELVERIGPVAGDGVGPGKTRLN